MAISPSHSCGARRGKWQTPQTPWSFPPKERVRTKPPPREEYSREPMDTHALFFFSEPLFVVYSFSSFFLYSLSPGERSSAQKLLHHRIFFLRFFFFVFSSSFSYMPRHVSHARILVILLSAARGMYAVEFLDDMKTLGPLPSLSSSFPSFFFFFFFFFFLLSLGGFTNVKRN